MEKINDCPICGRPELKAFISCTDFTVSRETFEVAQCVNCGFRFTNPRPNANEIGRYYQAEDYISHSDTNKGLVNKLYQLVRNYTIGGKVKLINRLNRGTNGATKSLLDIGCGTAEFLYACKQNGWSVTGIEPSEVARKRALEKYGITPLPQESFFEIKDKKFDVISMWHVLEHVHELDRTIDQISKTLDDNGTLIVAVPNCESWDAKRYGSYWAAWDLPRHLYHFTGNDIKNLFGRHKYELIEFFPMKFDSYYVSLLSEKCKSGRTNLIAGFMNGLKSNLFASSNGYSSQIYILKKKA